MPSPQSNASVQGRLFATDGNSPFNAQAAIVKSILSRIATSTLVQVLKVTNDGGVSPVGFVDLQPLVKQVDGDGNATDQPIIHGCPYSRLQGGSNAIIMDPQVGDIGVAVFASRDISGVVANRGPATPGTGGSFRWSDGLYIGGMLNGTPTQYVRFSEEGITLHSPTAITMDAPVITMTAPDIVMNASGSIVVVTPTLSISGGLQVSGAIVGDQIVAETSMTVASKSIGPAHEHHLSSGTTGGVV